MQLKRIVTAAVALTTVGILAGCETGNGATSPTNVVVKNATNTVAPGANTMTNGTIPTSYSSVTVQNSKLPSWLMISTNDVSSITIQGWGPGAAGNFTTYPANGTSSRLIKTMVDGLSSDKAIKPYQTAISKGGGEWIELKMKNGSTISLATFPNDPTPTQYVVTLNDKSQGPPRSTMISDVSGKVTSVFDEISKGELVRQTVQFPKAKDIQHVYVIAGLNGMSYTPKNQSVAVSQIEKWLQTAKPVSVQLPPPPNPPIVINANANPAVLELQLSSKQRVSISPTFYMAGHSQELSKLYHFVDGVISYQVGSKTVYFKDPELYNWLKNNQWEQQFNS